jgi:hypothetical protein
MLHHPFEEDAPAILHLVCRPAFAEATPELPAAESGMRGWIDGPGAYQGASLPTRQALAARRQVSTRNSGYQVFAILDGCPEAVVP